MTITHAVAQHYSIENILKKLESALSALGKTIESVNVDDLSQVDEFHIGGRIATEHFFACLGMDNRERVLDIGCGIGGAARFAAARHDASVVGVDLTETYIEVGTILNKWVGLEDKVSLNTGNATSLDYSDNSFDCAYTMHVCMNIEDKKAVFNESFRVLKPGAPFGVYDVTKYSDGALSFPVPWAADESTSFLATIDEYTEMLEKCGFAIEAVNDRHEFAVRFFEAVKAKMAAPGGPPPLGIHILMGEDSAAKITNLMANLIAGLIAPFEIIARKP